MKLRKTIVKLSETIMKLHDIIMKLGDTIMKLRDTSQKCMHTWLNLLRFHKHQPGSQSGFEQAKKILN